MLQKAKWSFGAGDLFFRKGGITPMKVATLQNIDIDISATIKELQGERRFAEAVASGNAKIGGKVGMGRFDHRVVSELFLNEPQVSGRVVLETKRVKVPAVAPFKVDVLSAGETFDSDLGVADVSTAQFYELTTAVAAGKYVVANGTYTFAEADKGKDVSISFIKGVVGGSTTYITNQLMDESPSFELVSADGKGMFIQLFSCVFNKLTLQRKNEDFLLPNLEFSAFADDIRGVGRLSGV